MGFISMLDDAKEGLEEFFKKALPIAEDVTKVAKEVEPFVDIVLPGFATLYNATVAEVYKAEALATAAEEQKGTGTQKMAMALSGIYPSAVAYAAANGIPVPDEAQLTQLVESAVTALKALPSTKKHAA